MAYIRYLIGEVADRAYSYGLWLVLAMGLWCPGSVYSLPVAFYQGGNAVFWRYDRFLSYWYVA